MERIKSFTIKATPTVSGSKGLADLIDDTINGYLEKHPECENPRIAFSARPEDRFPTALVIMTYEVGVMPETPTDEPIKEDLDKTEPVASESPTATEEVHEVTRRGRPRKGQ